MKVENRRELGLREALVAEGRTMFEESGATELSMRALARRLGVSEAAPFKHFAGKEDLLAAIAASGFKELRDERQEIAHQEADAFGRARAMMLSYIRYAISHEGLFNLMIGPRLSGFRDGEFGKAGQESFDLFSNAICMLAAEHDWPLESLELLSHTAWALEHGIAALLLAGVVPHKGSDLDVEELLRFSVDFLLRAIEGGPLKERKRSALTSTKSASSPAPRRESVDRPAKRPARPREK